MKNSNKRLKLVMGLMLSLLLFSACQSKIADKNGPSQSVTDVNKQVENEDLENNNDEVGMMGKSSEVSSSNIQPNSNTEVMIYVIDVETAEIVPVTALISIEKEITPEVIVNKVVEAMADASLEIGIDEVKTEGDTVIVSFLSDKAPVIDVGSGYEVSILNAIAQSIIDNTDYKNVIYRIEGKPYVTGHITLELDEIFLGDN